MNNPVRLLIHGAQGRMGQALIRLAEDKPSIIVVAKTGRSDLTTLKEVPEFDVAIDFSSPDGFFAVLALCVERKKALVSGTTGLSDEQFSSLQSAGLLIPVLWASNFSLGVAVLNQLVSQAGKWLKDWDIDITEAHHIHKKDAPSGTAISIAEGIFKHSDYNSWKLDETEGKSLGIEAIREGEVPGTHSVYYRSEVDEIEIKHTAFNRNGFALGAVIAAEWLPGKVGNFGMKEVLGL